MREAVRRESARQAVSGENRESMPGKTRSSAMMCSVQTVETVRDGFEAAMRRKPSPGQRRKPQQ